MHVISLEVHFKTPPFIQCLRDVHLAFENGKKAPRVSTPTPKCIGSDTSKSCGKHLSEGNCMN